MTIRQTFTTVWYGTPTGGRRYRETMIKKHGSKKAWSEFMSAVGAVGGRKGHTGGFAVDIECNCEDIEGAHFKRYCAGARGGRISKPGKRKQPPQKDEVVYGRVHE